MNLTNRLIAAKPRRGWLFLLLALSALGFAATATARQAGEPITVGVSMHFMRDDYALRLTDEIRSVIGAFDGSEVIVTDANADPPKQLTDMENLIVRGVDALIVVPIDEKAILPAIRRANRQGVPVVAITHIPNADVLATVAAEGDYANGRASGELLVEATGGQGKVAMIGIPYSLWRIEERERGFMDAIAESQLEVTARQAALDQAKVQDLVSGILVAQPDLAGIWCTFSNQLVGAADALRMAGRKDIVLTGIDADRAILERIRSGWIDGAAAQFPTQQGRLAAKAVVDHFSGKAVTEDLEIPVGVVTAANVDEMEQRIWGE